MKNSKRTSGEFYDDVSYVDDKDFAGMKYKKKKKKYKEEKKEIVMFDENDFLTENTIYDEISPEGGDEDDLSIEEYEEIVQEQKNEYIPQHITEEDYETYKDELQEYNSEDEVEEEKEEEIFKEEFDALKQTEEDEMFKDIEIEDTNKESEEVEDEDDSPDEDDEIDEEQEESDQVEEDIDIPVNSLEFDIFNDNFDAFEDVKDDFFGADFKTFGEDEEEKEEETQQEDEESDSEETHDEDNIENEYETSDDYEDINEAQEEKQVEEEKEEQQDEEEYEEEEYEDYENDEVEEYQIPEYEPVEIDEVDEEEEVEQSNLDERELSTEFVDKKNKKEEKQNKRTIISKEVDFDEWNDDYADEKESDYEVVNKHQEMAIKEKKNYPPKVKKEKVKKIKEPKEIKAREPIDLSNLKKLINIKYLSIIILLISIVSLISSMFIIYNSFGIKEKKKVSYKEISDISYKVFLNKNDDLYDEDKVYDSYLSKMIKLIKINMNYKFNIEEESNLLFNYRIVGDLIVNEKDTNKQIYKNTYVLSGYEKNEITKSTTYNIDKDISIDYWYYNDLAEKFTKTYSNPTESYLLVYLKIDEKDNTNNKFAFNNNATASIKIPLSESVVKLEIENVNKESKTSGKRTTGIVDASKFLFGIILFFITTLVLIYIKFKFFDKEETSEYKIKVKELIDKYDHLILITQFPPTDSKKINEFKTFEELLNIRKKLSQKIKYYEAKKHKESIFYIEDEEMIYIYKIINN